VPRHHLVGSPSGGPTGSYTECCRDALSAALAQSPALALWLGNSGRARGRARAQPARPPTARATCRGTSVPSRTGNDEGRRDLHVAPLSPFPRDRLVAVAVVVDVAGARGAGSQCICGRTDLDGIRGSARRIARRCGSCRRRRRWRRNGGVSDARYGTDHQFSLSKYVDRVRWGTLPPDEYRQRLPRR
jgi:hypothetical protein